MKLHRPPSTVLRSLLVISALVALSAASALKSFAAEKEKAAMPPAPTVDSLTTQLAAGKDESAKQLAAETAKLDRVSRIAEALTIQRDQNAKLAQDGQLQLALALQEIESLKKELAEAKARAEAAAAKAKPADPAPKK